jgi:signal transduction histidine kinase
MADLSASQRTAFAEPPEPSALLAQALSVLEAVLGEVSAGLYEQSAGGWTRLAGDGSEPAEVLSRSPDVGKALFLETPRQALYRLSEQHLLVAAAPAWDEPARRLLLAAGQNLAFDLERAARFAALEAGRGELEARSRALEAFAALTRELTLQADDVTLIRRAQEVALSLLPDGTALYYRLEGQLWRNISQVGVLSDAALQPVIDAGLPYAETNNLVIPWESGQPYYQDDYDHATDNLPELTRRVGATACLPVFMAGKPVGIFAVALAGARRWTATDRATLEAVTRSLSLAKEGARSVLALRDRSAELERSNRELEQFAYVASHDLQEPLRTVTSFAQLLVSRYRGQLDPKADVYLSMISDGTGRMSRLLQDLLAFSRVANSVQPLRSLEMNALLAEVRQDLQDQTERSGAEVSLGELPTVQGEASQIRQVFQNLIGNALKFSVPGRPVRVSVKAAPDEQIPGMLRFAVSDNGIGIAPAFHARIFTIFQRLHSRERFEGSGIGLAIARKIVERHGGELWVESAEGQGSTFFLTLPSAQVTE